MTEQSKWVQITQANPDHSTWYVERFRQMAASGADLVGEARLVDAYLGARPGLDATAFRRAYAIMAAQRATKILGIFARLDRRVA